MFPRLSRFDFVAVAGLLALAAAPAQARSLPIDPGSGTMTGKFSNFAALGDTIAPEVVEFSADNSSIGFSSPSTFPGFRGTSYRFTGRAFTNVLPGETFVLGELEIFNGTNAVLFSGNPGFFSVDLTVTSSSETTSPYSYNGQQLVTTILARTTINSGTEEENADIYYFSDQPQLGSFRVFEQESAKVEILGRFGSLDLVGFGNVLTPNTGFVNPSVEPITAVPEPTTVVGMLVFGTWVARQRLKAWA